MESQANNIVSSRTEVKKHMPMIHRIYVINLRRRSDRLFNFLEKCPFDTNEVTVFNAVNGKALTARDPHMEQFDVMCANFDRNNYRRSLAGCGLSHYRLWKQIASGEDEVVAIFEDDPTFHPQFMEIWDKASRTIPSGFDILWLGGARDYVGHSPYKERVNDSWSVMNEQFCWCAFSYVMTRECARKMVMFFDRHRQTCASDCEMWWACCFLKSYALNTFICWSNIMNQDSDIQRDYSLIGHNRPTTICFAGFSKYNPFKDDPVPEIMLRLIEHLYDNVAVKRTSDSYSLRICNGDKKVEMDEQGKFEKKMVYNGSCSTGDGGGSGGSETCTLNGVAVPWEWFEWKWDEHDLKTNLSTLKKVLERGDLQLLKTLLT